MQDKHIFSNLLKKSSWEKSITYNLLYGFILCVQGEYSISFTPAWGKQCNFTKSTNAMSLHEFFIATDIFVWRRVHKYSRPRSIHRQNQYGFPLLEQRGKIPDRTQCSFLKHMTHCYSIIMDMIFTISVVLCTV